MERKAAIGSWLQDALTARLSPTASAWLSGVTAAAADAADRRWLTAFGLAPRKLGKDALQPSAAECAAATAARPDWDPRRWTVADAGRSALLLARPWPDAATAVAELDRLFLTSDLGEAVACYQALPLLPHPAAWRQRAAEGLRSNMTVVFEAVAQRNPYPAEELDEGAWNQLVLKALFVGSRLDPIVGLDRRCNPALARMLVDYARERRAASRPISPELWRCVGPVADEEGLDLLAQELRAGNRLAAAAAALALAAGPGRDLLERLDPDRAAAVAAGRLDWAAIAAALDQP